MDSAIFEEDKKVGPKGQIQLSKTVRELVKTPPGTTVRVSATPDEITIRRQTTRNIAESFLKIAERVNIPSGSLNIKKDIEAQYKAKAERIGH